MTRWASEKWEVIYGLYCPRTYGLRLKLCVKNPWTLLLFFTVPVNIRLKHFQDIPVYRL